MRRLPFLASTVLVGMLTLAASAADAPGVGLLLTGADFVGGGAEKFGGSQLGEPAVNFVYARSTGSLASMRAEFDLNEVPKEAQFLHLKARDDDTANACPIQIKLNGKILLEGKSSFPSNEWAVQRLPVPGGVLKRGKNEIVISNTQAEGPAGNPPWFMIASCGIGGEKFVIRRDITRDFYVDLPREKREFPEPLPSGAAPGFKIRGTKGWNWTAEQYLAEIPVLAKYKMNFLMNCYLSMFDEQQPWNSGKANRWWEPIPDAKRRAYEKVVKACQQNGIEYCFAINPNLTSSRIMRYDNKEDLDALWQNYAWMADQGVNWFGVCLDDISQGIDPKGQARSVNELYHRLKAKNPKAQMVFCPTIYWATGDDPKEGAYLEALGAQLDPEIYCFWTGDGVVGRISRAAAEKYRSHIKHRLIVWDNYPVNDGSQALHLGPVTGRDPDLNQATDGYMSNPLCPQNEINRLPLLTIADYTYNPLAYDPSRSIGQAILHLADTPEQCAALKDLVEAYPGMLIYKSGTGFNALRHQFGKLLSTPHSRFLAEGYIRQMDELAARLGRVFPDRYADARKTLQADVAWMKQTLKGKYSNETETPAGQAAAKQ